MAHFDCLLRGARLATLDPALPELGLIEAGALGIRAGRIAFVGREADLPADSGADRVFDLDGAVVTPGLVDCHTHLVHAGDRASEFEMRLAGASYADIAKAGGGILSTVRATRAADEAALLAASLPRLDDFLAQGVTTIEIKSGYGLEADTELRQLRVARELGRVRPVRVATSFLGAHALPPDCSRADYLDLLVNQLIPAVSASGLADAVDGFCESIAFTPDEIKRLFAAASAAGLPVKLHAEQLAWTGGTALAARHGALSADHLEYTSEADVAMMAASGTVAVLLPGAYHFLRETQLPPIAALRAAGVPIALATDCNPGSSPLTSPLIAMTLAATCFRLTVPEIIRGFTSAGAQALGLADEIGTLEPGKRADLAVWNITRLAELPYRFGANPLRARLFGGVADDWEALA